MRGLLVVAKIRVKHFIDSLWFPFGNRFQPLFADVCDRNTRLQSAARAAPGISLQELITGLWHMGVPKSRVRYFDILSALFISYSFFLCQVSLSKKRMKHLKYFPDRVAWIKCEKCGEPKRSHRICTQHIDVCALSTEQWLKKKSEKNSADEIS